MTNPINVLITMDVINITDYILYQVGKPLSGARELSSARFALLGQEHRRGAFRGCVRSLHSGRRWNAEGSQWRWCKRGVGSLRGCGYWMGYSRCDFPSIVFTKVKEVDN